MAKGKYHKALTGKFTPKNPIKYDGDPNQIWFRSGMELRVMKWLDAAPAVLAWSSECVVIPYYNPIKKRAARYFPDFLIKTKDNKGNIKISVLEIKSQSETVEPKKKSRITRRLVENIITWEVNKAKWRQAEKFCLERGWEFKLLTEFDLGIKSK